jgi:transcriptional regulator with XRE-family HTH domain
MTDIQPTQPIRLQGSNARRPDWALVEYEGLPHLLWLRRVRRALLDSAVRGEYESRLAVADGAGVSRSTASRFVSGRHASTRTTKAILDVLGLQWEEVLYPLSDELVRELAHHARTARNGVQVIDVDPYELPGVRAMLERGRQTLTAPPQRVRQSLPAPPSS